MEITDITVHPLSVPDRADKADATQATAVIEVETDEGITGIGEASTSPWIVETIVNAPVSNVKVRGLRDIVVGRDPFDVGAIWDDCFHGTYGFGRKGAAINAISGIDIACWDIMGKATGKPVHALLGGSHRDRIRAYASTLFPEDPSDTDTVRRRAEAALDDGFTAVKFGWGGFGVDARLDHSLVGAAREVLGPDIDLMVDAGLVWEGDVKGAIKRTNSLDDEFDLFWLEEPVYADNLTSYARISEGTETRIVGGESEYTTYGFENLLRFGGVDGVQPDVARSGGITQLQRIARMADRHGVPFYPHGYSTDIVVAASLHLTAAHPREPLLEYCVEQGPLRWDLVEEDFPVEDGAVTVPDGPGLGISLDRDVLETYTTPMDQLTS